MSNPGENALLDRIDRALRGSSQLGRHPIELHDCGGQVVIRGRVKTFYQKQVAQELVRRIDGVQTVINQLEVHWTSVVPIPDATI